MGKNFFSIGEAAAQVHMTRETLRHYDRIGLVKPSRVDQRTKYRYYNEEDLVRLNTVHALQQMDLPLQEIHKVLEYNDLEKLSLFWTRRNRKRMKKSRLCGMPKARSGWRKQAMRKSFTAGPPHRAFLQKEFRNVF